MELKETIEKIAKKETKKEIKIKQTKYKIFSDTDLIQKKQLPKLSF